MGKTPETDVQKDLDSGGEFLKHSFWYFLGFVVVGMIAYKMLSTSCTKQGVPAATTATANTPDGTDPPADEKPPSLECTLAAVAEKVAKLGEDAATGVDKLIEAAMGPWGTVIGGFMLAVWAYTRLGWKLRFGGEKGMYAYYKDKKASREVAKLEIMAIPKVQLDDPKDKVSLDPANTKWYRLSPATATAMALRNGVDREVLRIANKMISERMQAEFIKKVAWKMETMNDRTHTYTQKEAQAYMFDHPAEWRVIWGLNDISKLCTDAQKVTFAGTGQSASLIKAVDSVMGALQRDFTPEDRAALDQEREQAREAEKSSRATRGEGFEMAAVQNAYDTL